MARERRSDEDVVASLQEGRLANVYLLCGEEDLLAEEAMEAIIGAALAPHERHFNLDHLRASDTDIRQIRAIASSFPMMSARRVVVVHDVDRFTAKEVELLLAFVEHPPPTTILILTAGDVDMRKRPFSTLKSSVAVQVFKHPFENRLPAWIAERIAREGGSITPDAAQLLAAYAGPSLRSIHNEISKLLTFTGRPAAITVDEVSSVVGVSREYTVFELQRAIGLRNRQRAAEILERMMEAGENPPRIIVMLTSYVLTLWKVLHMLRAGTSTAAIAGDLHVKEYRAHEYRQAAERFTRQEIEDAFGVLARADEQVKGASPDERFAMLECVLRIVGNGRERAS